MQASKGVTGGLRRLSREPTQANPGRVVLQRVLGTSSRGFSTFSVEPLRQQVKWVLLHVVSMFSAVAFILAASIASLAA